MLLSEAKAPWADPAFQATVKWDGYRLLAQIDGDRVSLRTRKLHDATRWYPELQSLAHLTTGRTVLDGEVVVLDAHGRSDFDRLHARSMRRRGYAGADPVVLMVFDVLLHDGQDVRAQHLKRRTEILQGLLERPPAGVMLCKDLPGDQAPALFAAAVKLKLEGIVMKRWSSPYACGQRNGDWVKIKRRGATPAGRFARGDLSL